MKFSRSILIFLFVSSILGAFSYPLNRTDGNVSKSVLFTLYFLAIEIGLIPPNVPLKLDHHQPNQQLVCKVQTLPVYNPYVSVLDDYRPSGLYMDNIQRPVSQHDLSYHSQSVINELRAGDSRVTQAAWLLITIWMLRRQSLGFHPVRQAPMPTHLESARNLLFGKPKPDQFSCRRLSMFDSQQFENQNVNTNHFKNSPNYFETVKFNDGYKAKAVNVQLDHILGVLWSIRNTSRY
jgi:hypothetical protein